MYQKECDILNRKLSYNVLFIFLVVLISIAISSCLIPGAENTGSSSKDNKGVFSFYIPSASVTSTGVPISGPLTPPASVVIDFKYTGFIPIRKLEITVKRENDEKLWLKEDFTSTKHATVLFNAGNSAGDFVCDVSLTDLYGRKRDYSSSISIDDITPPNITKMEFHTTEGTLVPIEKNQVFFWMELSDDESNLFDEITIGNLRDKTRFYLNGADISTSFWYQNEEMFITGAKNKLVCIGNAYLGNLNEGSNELKVIMGQFGADEQDFVYYATSVTAGYPDTTPPQILDYDFQPAEAGDSFVDFKIKDEFTMYLNVKDEADRPMYKPSGLKEVVWYLKNSKNDTVQGTYTLNSLESANVVIPFEMNSMSNYTGDGIYSLFVEVSDQNGNTATLGPVFFELGITQFETLKLKNEKIHGDLLDVNYFVGETIRFTVDTEWSFDTALTWEVNPDVQDKTSTDQYFDITPVKAGEYTVTVKTTHKQIPCYGYDSITVLATPVFKDNIPPKYTFVKGNETNPSVPSKLTITDNMPLPDEKDDLFTFKSAIKTDQDKVKTPLNVKIIGPLENSGEYVKEFWVYTEDILGSSTSTELLANEKVEIELWVEDINSNKLVVNELFSN